MTVAVSPIVGAHTSQGRREVNCDAAAEHWRDNGVLAAAVAAGINSSRRVQNAAHLAVEIAIRVGAKSGALHGLLEATAVLGDLADDLPPDAVMVLAVCTPFDDTVIEHVGDCAAFAFDDRDLGGLVRLTEDQTSGQRRRARGEPETEAARFDHEVTNTVCLATYGTVPLARTRARIVVLASDGVHRRLSFDQMDAIVREHHDNPHLRTATRRRRPRRRQHRRRHRSRAHPPHQRS